MASGAYGLPKSSLKKREEERGQGHESAYWAYLPSSRRSSKTRTAGGKGFVRGHAVVAHWSRPIGRWQSEWPTAFSRRSSKIRTTRRCLSRAICTHGPLGSITNPSPAHLCSLRCRVLPAAFFLCQLSLVDLVDLQDPFHHGSGPVRRLELGEDLAQLCLGELHSQALPTVCQCSGNLWGSPPRRKASPPK